MLLYDTKIARPLRPKLHKLVKHDIMGLVRDAKKYYVYNQLAMFSRDFDPVEAAHNVRKVTYLLTQECFEIGVTKLCESLGLVPHIFHHNGRPPECEKFYEEVEHTILDARRLFGDDLRAILDCEYTMLELL